MSTNSPRPKVIFFGNGALAEAALSVLESSCNIIFHAKTRDDLAAVRSLKLAHPDAFGILASFGVLIKSDLLSLFEPAGILNLHPSLLPRFRGASPIESAILAGDSAFSISIMKLVKAMDAGPIYYQETLQDLPLDKKAIYEALAKAGAEWLSKNIMHLPKPVAQDETKATFTTKLSKKMSELEPGKDTAEATLRKIVALQGFPKPKYKFFNQETIILAAHVEENCSDMKHAKEDEKVFYSKTRLALKCSDEKFVIIDRLQPASRKAMETKAFLNGINF